MSEDDGRRRLVDGTPKEPGRAQQRRPGFFGWGQGIEVMADKYNLSTSGGIRLVTFLDADVIVRQPSAFAVGTILK